jgi:hypothetical protein
MARARTPSFALAAWALGAGLATAGTGLQYSVAYPDQPFGADEELLEGALEAPFESRVRLSPVNGSCHYEIAAFQPPELEELLGNKQLPIVIGTARLEKPVSAKLNIKMVQGDPLACPEGWVVIRMTPPPLGFVKSGPQASWSGLPRGPIAAVLGDVIRFDAPYSTRCAVEVVKATVADGRELANLEGRTSLPIMIASGEGKTVATAGEFRLTVRYSEDGCGGEPETAVVHFEAPPAPRWSVADTVAYVITRDSRGTAAAGVGAFVRVPKIGGFVNWVAAVHVLPGGEGTGEFGLAPLGVGLWGNRFVFGWGWNLSRWGDRPDRHNFYFYAGGSVTKLFSSGHEASK